METLSLAFILKDEAETIEQAIKAFWYDNEKPMYSELVVGIDNKTSDNTYDIVSQYTDKVTFFDFNNDFASSRNNILKKCVGDYIFMPDGHEILKPESREIIQHFLVNVYEGVRLMSPYVAVYEDDYYCCLKKCSKLNLPKMLLPRPMFLKNGHDIYFKEAIHNYLDTDDKYKRILPEIMLDHRMPAKRQKNRIKQRSEINAKGLNQMLSHSDNDRDKSRANFYLGNTYSETGDIDKAIECYKESMESSDSNDEKLQLMINIGYILCQLGRHREARDIIMENGGLACRWDRAEPYFLLGWAASGLEKYTEAKHWYNICLTLNYPITQFFLYVDMYTWFPHDALMDVNCKLGDVREALKHAKALKPFKPDCVTVDYNIEHLTSKVIELDMKKMSIVKQKIEKMIPRTEVIEV